MDCAKIPWEDSLVRVLAAVHSVRGQSFVLEQPKENVTNASKFAPKGEDGIFLGYHIQPRFIWRQEYIVAPLKGSREAIEK